MIEIKFKNTKGYDKSIAHTPITRTVYTSDAPLAGEEYCVGFISDVDKDFVYGFLFTDFHELKTADHDKVSSLELIF